MEVMNMQKEYSANLTGEPYLYFELKQVAKLKLIGLSNNEIRQKIAEENLFQYDTNKSISKILSATLNRVAVLDEPLLNMLVNGSLQTSKLVALIAVMKINRLFFEFVAEVYKEKVRILEPALEPKDFRIFFNNKIEQSSKVAGWHDYTLQKLAQVYCKILFESGLLSDVRKKVITPPTIDEDLREHLSKNGDEGIIAAITGGRK